MTTTASQAPQGPSTPDPGGAGEDAALAEVRRALAEIEYGSVLIKIHQGEVVGIETSRKVRLKGT